MTHRARLTTLAERCAGVVPGKEALAMALDLHRRQFLRHATRAGIVVLTGGLLSRASWTLAAPATRPTSRPVKQAEAIARIAALAEKSPIASYRWADRGKAPAGYVKGMAVSYAKLYAELDQQNPYAVEMAKAMSDDATRDALKHYEAIFQQVGMDNSQAGADTLRHLFVLLLGLGMRESSGKHCEGRDRSADNTTAETAEAGLFQTSYNARRASPLLPRVFADYKSNPRANPTYLDLFKEGVRCKESNLENFGEGDGRLFQKLSKEAPFFAVTFTAIGLRNVRRHWGPINRHAAEVKPDADAMFMEVQTLMDKDKLGPVL